MENPTHGFRETNLVLQVMEESKIKSKTVMSWSSRKKKEGIFCIVYFVERKFCRIFFFFFQSIVCQIHFQNIQTFTYKKTIISVILLPVFKIVESFQRILRKEGGFAAHFL